MLSISGFISQTIKIQVLSSPSIPCEMNQHSSFSHPGLPEVNGGSIEELFIVE